MSAAGLWHYPATISDDSIATPFAEFGTNDMFDEPTVAGVINDIDGRQQMVWFTAWATEWSVVSNYMQHAYIHWMTRGLCESLCPRPPENRLLEHKRLTT